MAYDGGAKKTNAAPAAKTGGKPGGKPAAAVPEIKSDCPTALLAPADYEV